MPSNNHDEARDTGTYTHLDLGAMEAAGDIELVRPGTPEAAGFDREMTDELDAYNRDQLERDGPDAVTSVRMLRQAGLLAERDAGTVGATLASFRERIGLDHTGVGTWLGVNPTQLAALALCERPDPASPAFSEAVEELARRYGADPGRLLEAVE